MLKDRIYECILREIKKDELLTNNYMFIVDIYLPSKNRYDVQVYQGTLKQLNNYLKTLMKEVELKIIKIRYKLLAKEQELLLSDFLSLIEIYNES